MTFPSSPRMIWLIVIITLPRWYIPRHFQNVFLLTIAQCQWILVIYRKRVKFHGFYQIWSEMFNESPQISKTIHWNRWICLKQFNFFKKDKECVFVFWNLSKLLGAQQKKKTSAQSNWLVLTVNDWYNSSSNMRWKLFQ